MFFFRPARALPRVARCALVAVFALSACSRGATETPALSLARPCPQWVEYPADDHSNAGSPFLGCTNAANLENMLDRPGDLDHGRELGAASGERETLGVGAYEQGLIKAFPDENASQAKPTLEMPGSAGGASP